MNRHIIDDLLAALAYRRTLGQQRAALRMVHPWMVAAYEQLSADLGEGYPTIPRREGRK